MTRCSIPTRSALEGTASGGILQRKCADCGNHTISSGECESCRNRGSGVEQVISSAGQPLDTSVRRFMEPRFHHDFSHVRLHVNPEAAESARALNALAYTLGQHIVFGAGQYSPHSSGGRHLMAHELTHTVQQSAAGAPPTLNRLAVGAPDTAAEREADRVADAITTSDSADIGLIGAESTALQRACGLDQIGEPSGCEQSSGDVEGPKFLFRVNCDEFARGNELDLRAVAETFAEGEIIEIHGLASEEGDPVFNQNLSCARALRAKQVIEEVLALRGVTVTLRVFQQGAVSGDATLQRSVVVTRTTPAPPAPAQRCGPDATNWFIRQIAAAKTDPIVLAIQARLAGARRVAMRFGFSAERVAEGAVAKKVLAEETRAGSPARTPEATSQMAASVPGQREFGRALLAATIPLVGAPEAMVLAAIKSAALTWKGLVGTGMRYDFKNSPRTLQSPTSANCPSDCNNTITLCPSSGSDCFVKDVPGNLFYAHIGRIIGWTELSLQLGSQFAQLDSSRTWDPPEDTRMISIGFALPDPLTSADLCSSIAANRSAFDMQSCANCPEEVSADVV